MSFLLTLDQGTTSSRAAVFDEAGRLIVSHSEPFAQHFVAPGWVEHRPQDIYDSQLRCARAAIASLQQYMGEGSIQETLGHIRALGIANQRETTMLWDRQTGEPIANAIVWQDRRTAKQCALLARRGYCGIIAQKTGLVLDACFSATKLAWLLEHVPDARARAERGQLCFGTVDTWLVYKLSEGRLHVSDVSNASRTMLFNIHTLQWDAQLLRLFSIPPQVLPKVVPSSGVAGETAPGIFGRALPIAAIVGDQQAAAFGQHCFAPGAAKNTYGTGCFMLMNTGNRPATSRNRLLSTVGWSCVAAPQRPAYCLEGSVFMGGATVQWLRDGLQMISSAAEIEPLAATVADSGDVYLVPAHVGLGAPHWDGFARAAIVGITRGTTRAHIARAALEGIAWQCAEVFAAMRADAGVELNELRVDGGATTNDLLMQLQADILGVPVVRAKIVETTALGAACLAGLAVGVWSDATQLGTQRCFEREFLPQWSEDEREVRAARWRGAVLRAKSWARLPA